MNKREFLRRIGIMSASAAVFPVMYSSNFNVNPKCISYLQDKPGYVSLKDKFFGCIAGVRIGSSMGAPLDCSSYEKTEKEYGTLDKLLPYHHYGNSNNWMREPGTTKDGVERQKLITAAII